jgi:hypothetical protein
MRPDQAIKRLQAWHKGRPLPSYKTRHFAIAEDKDLLIVAFVRMGGESAPWGIAWGHPGKKPEIRSVPEARNRDAVAEMVANFAPILLKHYWSPLTHDWKSATERDRTLPLRQVWLPNGSHIEMLHFLAYSYSFTKFGEATRYNMLNALGRLSGWLFREHDRPGQMTVMAATDALKRTYDFPAEDVRQAHLGFLLAWLETSGRRKKRLQAAQEAEEHSISMTLDPAIERDVLEPLIEKWNDHRLASRIREAAKADIASAIEKELKERFSLVEQSIQHLRTKGPRENRGVAHLAQGSLEEHWYQYLRLELRRDDPFDGNEFTPSPETDRNPAAAASRYFVQQASEEFSVAALIHDDEDLQREVVMQGNGIQGKCVGVRDDGEGTRRMEAIWTVHADEVGALRIRPGDTLCVVGRPKRHLQVLSIERRKNDVLEIELEVIGAKKEYKDERGRMQPAANSKAFIGDELTLVPVPFDQISRRKNTKIWNAQGPGAWITHAKPEAAKSAGRTKPSTDKDNLFEKLGRL